MMKLIISLLFICGQSWAADDNTLNKVYFEEKDGKTLVHFELSKPIDMASVETRFLRRTVEWDLKNVTLKKDKMFLNVSSNDINNVYISHADEKSLRIRVNLDNGKWASNYHDRLSFTLNKSVLTLISNNSVSLAKSNLKELHRIYEVSAAGIDKKIADHISKASVLKVSAAEDASETAQATEAVAGAAVSSPLADLDESDMALVDEEKAENQIPLKAQNKDSKATVSPSLTRILMGFGAVGLMLLSIVLIGKKINSKRLGASKNQESIHVVSQKYLGPKRNLTLVRVAGEYLLLGVTDSNISLIKSLAVVDDEIPELSPTDFGSAVKSLAARAESDLDEQIFDVEDSFSVSSLGDVKKLIKKRRYIDE